MASDSDGCLMHRRIGGGSQVNRRGLHETVDFSIARDSRRSLRAQAPSRHLRFTVALHNQTRLEWNVDVNHISYPMLLIQLTVPPVAKSGVRQLCTCYGCFVRTLRPTPRILVRCLKSILTLKLPVHDRGYCNMPHEEHDFANHCYHYVRESCREGYHTTSTLKEDV